LPDDLEDPELQEVLALSLQDSQYLSSLLAIAIALLLLVLLLLLLLLLLSLYYCYLYRNFNNGISEAMGGVPRSPPMTIWSW
jgi:hypothetical protein